jgi:hypothetical protein
MKAEARIALGLTLALVVTCAALAQTAPAAPEAPPPVVQRAGSVEYLNGGAGEEERAAMTAQRSAFSLRIVFSQPGGAYAVADHVDVAGPLLMLKLAPGDYTVDARFVGRTERRQVRVGRDGTQLDWRLPDEPR